MITPTIKAIVVPAYAQIGIDTLDVLLLVEVEEARVVDETAVSAAL
jgi:hypothetical protein